MSALDGLLFVLLDCGSLDISILDDVGYDLGDIAVELQEEGVNVTLNNITDAIFRKGPKGNIAANQIGRAHV